MDKVRLKNMVFYAYHGVYGAERELGQKFEVDVELEADLGPAGRSDDLALAIDYTKVYGLVRGIVEGRAFSLIEGLAEAIARELVETFEVSAVVVRVRKPHAPMGGLLDSVEVEIRREGRAKGGIG